jgi:pyroglutamyl-peptidase
MKFLITGFETFYNHIINPSQKIVESLTENDFQGVDLIKTVLPVDYIQAPKILLEIMYNYQPDVILAFGLASSRFKIGLERVAINLMDSIIPDNNGSILTDQPIIENGPAAYFSRLPLRVLLNILQENIIPVEISLTAGSYLCNQVFFTMMHEIESQNLPIIAGFIHLPALPEEAAQSNKVMPSLSLSLDLKAAQLMVKHLSH